MTPPFLVFEFSAQFSEKVKELDGIPERITVYGESYELGGVTSFLKNRSHYVAYIPMKDEFLLYDGIPQENHVSKKYRLNCIRGEISLLCFFPVEDDIDISCSNANSKGNNLTSIKTGEELQSSSTAQRVLVSDLVPYLHFDRDIQRLPGKRKKYDSTLVRLD